MSFSLEALCFYEKNHNIQIMRFYELGKYFISYLFLKSDAKPCPKDKKLCTCDCDFECVFVIYGCF